MRCVNCILSFTLSLALFHYLPHILSLPSLPKKGILYWEVCVCVCGCVHVCVCAIKLKEIRAGREVIWEEEVVRMSGNKKPRGGWWRSNENLHINRQFLHFLSDTGSHRVSVCVRRCVCVPFLVVFSNSQASLIAHGVMSVDAVYDCCLDCFTLKVYQCNSTMQMCW